MVSKILNRSISGQFYINLGYYALFSGIIFFILLHIYEPALLNFRLQPFFAVDPSYFDYFSNQHLGSLKILSNFILQYLAFPIGGSLLVTALLVLLSLMLSFLLNLISYPYLRGIEFIPSMLILASLKNYSTGLEMLVILLVVSLIMLLCQLIPRKYFLIRLLWYLLGVTGIYFLFDPVTALALVVLSGLHELTISRSGFRFLLPLLSAGLLILLISQTSGFIMLKPLLWELNADNRWAAIPRYYMIFGISSLIFLIVLLLPAIARILKSNLRVPNWLLSIVSVSLILIIGIILKGFLFQYSRKYNTEIEYAANQENWEEVLDHLKKVTIDDRISLFQLNRALYHVGEMETKLFTVPQTWGLHTLFLTIEFTRECPINSSDLFFDMGFIKGAEYWALEAQTFQPYAPRILKRLAICSIILDDIEVAEKYLTILNSSVINRNWVKEIRAELYGQGSDHFRKRIFGDRKTDFDILYIDNNNPNYTLIQILKKDPGNKMAFEYLMSYYLLSSEIGNFQFFLSEYGNYNRGTLPQLYQEALLLYMMTKNIPEEELKYSIHQSVKARMTAFNKILIEYKLNDRRARKDLHRLYGDTYWYYMRYTSPEVTGSQLKRRSL